MSSPSLTPPADGGADGSPRVAAQGLPIPSPSVPSTSSWGGGMPSRTNVRCGTAFRTGGTRLTRDSLDLRSGSLGSAYSLSAGRGGDASEPGSLITVGEFNMRRNSISTAPRSQVNVDAVLRQLDAAADQPLPASKYTEQEELRLMEM